MIDPETKQLLRVIAAAATVIAEAQTDNHEVSDATNAALRWLKGECDLLASFREEKPQG